MALTRDAGKFVSKGSGRAWYKLVNSDGTDYSVLVNGVAADTWHDLPLIKDSALKDSTATTTAEDEGGNQYTSDGARTIEWSGNFLQRDIDTRNLMVSTLRNKYVAIIKEDSVVHVGGKYEYKFIPAAKPIPEIDSKFPGGETPFKFMPQAVPSAVAIALASVAAAGVTPVAATAFTGTITCAAGDAYVNFNLS